MTEPIYSYVKGQGWEPRALEFVIREHEGRKYLVYGELRSDGRIKAGERSTGGGYGLAYALQNSRWFEEWEGIPAGFGGGRCSDAILYASVVILTTVPL